MIPFVSVGRLVYTRKITPRGKPRRRKGTPATVVRGALGSAVLGETMEVEHRAEHPPRRPAALQICGRKGPVPSRLEAEPCR